MAQVECVQNVCSDLPTDDDCTPAKKMKQARLPFKTMDQKTQLISPKSNISKKRKLSDAESPSAKIAKTPKSKSGPATDSVVVVSGETEVSSSSEAENVKVRVRNTLERFVRKNSQEEITSSTNSVCIDLTDSEDGKESDLSFVEVDTCQSKNIKEFFSVTSKESTRKIETEKVVENYIKIIEAVSKGTIPSENDDGEDKENLVKPVKQDLDVSIVSADSELDDSTVDPKTPGKKPTSSSSTVFKTPVSSKLSPRDESTPLSQSPGDSQSDSTPKSGKKSRSKLTEAQRKEKEVLRQKIKEEKLKVLDEKKKQKEEEKVEKEKEREKLRIEREAAKAEKERLRKEDKEKKEKERLEKLQQKEEETKKKKEELEAKMEEKKKKDEEKRLKEEEKQKENEEKIKKEKKIKEAFQSFFIKNSTSPTSSKTQKESTGLFMPFQVKENTRLAPERRTDISEENKNNLDTLMNDQKRDTLYLSELKTRKIGKSGKTYHKEAGDDDVELLCHDKETVKKVTFRCKLLQFHMNYRPAYYGTWRKKSQLINPRNPFKTDTELLDYEYDSDDDWEEEEPGESLSDCEDEDDKDEECKEEEGDGWMVPHGYLSDDEGIDNDEEVTPEVMKIRRQAKAEQWESELARQTKPVLPQIIGVFWEQATHALQEEISKQLEEYRSIMLMTGPVPTSFNEPVKPVKGDHSAETGLETPKVNPQRKPVPEEAMPDLIRLVHGNLMGIKKLIKEFRTFWRLKTTGEQEQAASTQNTSMETDETDAKPADTSLSTENINNKSVNVENEADESKCAISIRQMELKINSIAAREKRAEYKKVCWYVNDEVLKQYNCEGLPIPSAWEAITQPAKTPAKPKQEETTAPGSGRKTPVPSITQFARPMSPSSIAAQHAAAQAKILAIQAEKKKEIIKDKEPEKMDISDPVEDNLNKKGTDQRKLTEFAKTLTSPQCKKPIALKPSAAYQENESPDSTSEPTVKEDVNLLVKPLKKPIELPKVNGMVIDATGDNSKEAIVLD